MTRIAILSVVLLLAACGEKGNGKVDPNNDANNPTNNKTTGNTSGTTGNNTTGTTGNNNTTGNNTTGTTTAPGDLTYHADVRPIMEAECTQCHYDGGIGPFPLTTYAEVKPLTALIASAVGSDTMPPWPPADDCGGPFLYERNLEPAEKSAILDWITAGAPEGNEADYMPPDENTVALGTPDLTFDIGVDYVPDPPNGGTDDYHCFIVEHDLDTDAYMNAFQVRPGNIATAHHVLFWQIDESSLANARNKESSPGAGYTCFGGSGVGGDEGLLGVWAPGAQPLKYADGLGFKIPANSFFVVQVHYNTLNGTDPDRTEIDMWFTDGTPQVPLAMYPLADTGIQIPAGRVDDKNDEGDARGQFNFTLPIGIPVYGVVPHMHTLGSRIRVTAGDQCLIDIPEWDFNWQGIYLFEDPVQLQRNDNVQLNCWYDNSMQNQQNGRTPQDVSWGDGTYDEMCLNYVIIRELPI